MIDQKSNKQAETVSASPLEPVVVPPEVLDLLRFMCETWVAIDEWARKHCTTDAIGSYPVIQGTRNQMALMRIARQPYDPANLGKAAQWMQRYNAEAQRKTGKLLPAREFPC